MGTRMWSLDEVALVPERISTIKSRSEIDTRYSDGKLPIFVAPMTCIVDRSNFDMFNVDCHAILPVRYNEGLGLIGGWQAVTLDAFRTLVNSGSSLDGMNLCVDVADGHMVELYELARKFKAENNDVQLMLGNIANPRTYIDCCKNNVDYVRVGIGGGSGCTTSVISGFHASLPWLLDCIKDLHAEGWTYTKVVADGGVNTFDRAIKCLALGADYVMMGRLFAECEGSVADRLSRETEKAAKYYGQSSVQGQTDRFGYVKGNVEGCESIITINGTLDMFLLKFEHALRTAMSYANARTLEDFVGNVEWYPQSLSEFRAYMK